MNGLKEAPKHLGRTVAIIFLVIMLFIGGLVGSYALSIHESNIQAHQRAVATAKRNASLKLASEKAAILGSVPLCRGLVLMDDASHPPVSNASSKPDSYGHKLAHAIHVVVVTSKCPILLHDIENHVPYTQIFKDLGMKQ